MPLSVLIVLTSNQRRGAEVEGSQLAQQLRERGMAAEVVALSGAATNPIGVQAIGDRPLSWSVLCQLRTRSKSADVVIAYGSTALPACVLALAGTRTPFIYRSIGDPTRWVRGRLHRWRTGLLFRRAAHVVALWPAAGASISSLYGVPAERLSCIANARPSATLSALSKSAARAALGLPALGPVIAWVGTLSSEKRPEMAVRAVAELSDGFLAIAGDGPLQPVLADEAELLLDGRHRFLGVLDDLAPLWAAAEVVMLTSRTEGMPGVLIEAALHGVPAAAVDVGAVSSVVIDNVTGRVVPHDAGPAALAAALTDTLANAQRMGPAAAAHASERFTWDVVAPEWFALLNRVGSRSR